MTNAVEITLVVILEKPPAGVDYALQKGSGSKYETVQKQRSAGNDLSFEITVTVKRSENSIHPDFRGPFVQGPLNKRFFYIDIGTYAGQPGSPWSRRLKIPLYVIPAELIDQLTVQHFILTTRVPGTGKDNGPNCGTVKPFNGWAVK